MDLNVYMEQGIKRILSATAGFYLKNSSGREFLMWAGPALREAARKRSRSEEAGLHVPPFLIASIASDCNLRCAGCYARAGGTCGGGNAKPDMGTQAWERIFEEASEIGVSFVMLAGGEPLLKREIIEKAASFKDMIFPIFTNGILLDRDYLELLEKNRNLIPVISIEGSGVQTDIRRGQGVAEKLDTLMQLLQKRGILFAVSITVTSENVHNAVRLEYVEQLRGKGCGIVFYVEYVPAQEGTEGLVLSEEQLEWLAVQTLELKDRMKDMAILSFPGDERYMGGCLAAGRGFFHISPSGAAEPCPFSPFSVLNIEESSLKEVLQSSFFKRVQEIGREDTAPHGGCTLFAHEEEVRAQQQEQK